MAPNRHPRTLHDRVVVDEPIACDERFILAEDHAPREGATEVVLDPLVLLDDAVLVVVDRRRTDAHVEPQREHLAHGLYGTFDRFEPAEEAGTRIDALDVRTALGRIVIPHAKRAPLLALNRRMIRMPRPPCATKAFIEVREHAILVDAMAPDGTAGRVLRREADDARLATTLGSFASSHAFNLAEAVALGRALGRLPTRLVIYGIEGASFAPGSAPGAAVRAAITDVAQRIREEIETCTKQP